MPKLSKTRKKKPATKRARTRRKPKVHRCGEAGGKTNAGQACGQKVRKKGALCRAHTNTADATLRASKKKVLDLMSTGKRLIDAAREIQKDPATVYRWRIADSEFDAAVLHHVEENDEARTRVVEQTLYDDIVDGKASPAERMFWLVNRDRVRWKNRHSQETLGADGKPVDQVPLAQLQAIAAKIDTLEVNIVGDVPAITIPVKKLKEAAALLDGAKVAPRRKSSR